MGLKYLLNILEDLIYNKGLTRHLIYENYDFRMSKQNIKSRQNMQRIYFFNNLNSNNTVNVPVQNTSSTPPTVASFQVSYTSSQTSIDTQLELGIVATGFNLNWGTDVSLNLEIFDGINWTVVATYYSQDLTFSDGTTPITQILGGGIYYNTPHRLTISNPTGTSLVNITAYCIINDNAPIYSSDYIVNLAFSEIPYSVTSAKIDGNGYANFITVNSNNTQIDFDQTTPITCCYPEGSAEINTAMASITGITTNGYFYIVKEKGSSCYATTTKPVEGCVPPSSPIVNQLWLNTAITPFAPKKWNGSAWVTKQFVKLGEFSRTNNVISGLVQYALNGKYTSQLTTIDKNTNILIQHNLGVQSYLISENIYVVNVNPELGYSAGDVLGGAMIFNSSPYPASVYATPIKAALSSNSAKLLITTAASGTVGIIGYNKTATGAPAFINLANWRLVFVYSRNI